MKDQIKKGYLIESSVLNRILFDDLQIIVEHIL